MVTGVIQASSTTDADIITVATKQNKTKQKGRA
jgi:hypothetical protein